jgi:hypothetical protein
LKDTEENSVASSPLDIPESCLSWSILYLAFRHDRSKIDGIKVSLGNKTMPILIHWLQRKVLALGTRFFFPNKSLACTAQHHGLLAARVLRRLRSDGLDENVSLPVEGLFDTRMGFPSI